MQLTSDDWRLLLTDPATNYYLFDFAVAHIEQTPGHPKHVVVFDAEHIETKVRMRLTFQIPSHMVSSMGAALASMGAALAASAFDSRQEGASDDDPFD